MTGKLSDVYDPTFYKTVNRGSGSSARVCVPLVVDLLSPSSVVDVGCGQGEWLQAFADLGVVDYHGVDGGHITDAQLVIPPERFSRHNLTEPLRLGRCFDVGLSLEVGEHLPARAAPAYIAGLVALAPAVVFSAAVPGQGGVNHVNEQWPWYWKELFARHGYVQLDPFRKTIWQNPEVAVYYQHNLFLYVDPRAHQGIIDRVGVPDKYTELTLVRTSILEDLTGPGILTRLFRRLGRLFGATAPSPKASLGRRPTHG
jgi:hypothetical protein